MTQIQPPIQSFDELQKLFKARVELDNAQFGIKSLYLPNPIFTPTQKYCLIAMEPSWVDQDRISRGFKNFVGGEGDSILQDCAYTFLCHDSFDYHITDISKGAVRTEEAKVKRNIRRANWLSLLKQELEFFGNPSVITIGRIDNDLKKAGIKV
ncbi:MAG: hypothetical protein ACRD9R_01725, partial [Pyrinomonadaceae bacterium]